MAEKTTSKPAAAPAAAPAKQEPPAKQEGKREVTREEIARRAFELSLVHDRSDEENWLEAERELRGE